MWRYRGSSRPDTWCGPGLCHQCEGQRTGHPPSLGHPPPPPVHMQLIFPNHILLSACSGSSSVTMPSFGQVLMRFSGVVEGTSPVQSDLPWPHQLAAPEHGDCRLSPQSVFEDGENNIFSPTFLLVLHLFFLEFLEYFILNGSNISKMFLLHFKKIKTQMSDHLSYTRYHLTVPNSSAAPLESIEASRDHRTPSDLWHHLLCSSLRTFSCVIDAEGRSLNQKFWCLLNQWVFSHQLQ